MKLTHPIGFVFSTLIMLLAAAAQNPETAMLPVGSATLADFGSGLVLHAPDGAVLDPVRGMTLAPETVIDTEKNSALLNLQDGSQVLVKSHSHVVLQAPNQGPGYSLQLAIGKIIARVKKRLGNSPSFRMGTPTAVITVRGTRFQVDVDKQRRTRVEVFEGIVEVRGMGAGLGAVLLNPGYLTHVQRDHDPERPQSMEHEPGRAVGPGGALGDDRTGEPGREPGENRPGSQEGGEGREDEPH